MTTTTESLTLVSQIKRWLKLRNEIDRRKAELTDLTRDFNSYGSQIDEQMALDDIQNVGVDGQAVYRTKRRSVTKRRGVDVDELCQVLKGTDMSYLVAPTCNSSSLKSAVLERLDKKEPLPPGLSDLIEVETFQTIAARKAS